MNEQRRNELDEKLEQIPDDQWKPLSWNEEDQREVAERLPYCQDALVDRPLLALTARSGLSPNEAKTVVYWAAATNGVDKLDTFPILLLKGKPSTGKSETLKIISKITDSEYLSITTTAELRDKLIGNRVVLLEEADNVNEELLRNRYSRESGKVDTKKSVGFGVYESKLGNIYGATALHRRHDFEDLALQSRCIVISTRKVEKQFHELELNNEDKESIKKLWDDAWTRFGDYQASGRTENNWRPLIMVALALGDLSWIRYANHQQEKDKQDLAVDGEFEPEQILAYAVDHFRSEPNPGYVYLSEIINFTSNSFMWKPSPKKLAQIARDEGYTLVREKKGYAIKLV